MPFRQDGYETSAGSVINTDSLVSKIKESIIKDDLDKVVLGVHSSGKVNPLFITGALTGDSQIPLFTHPILIKNFRNADYLCTDLRLVFSKDVTIEDYNSYIRDKPTYALYKSRAILNLAWLNMGPSSLRIGFDLASATFSRWVSQTLSSKYGLDYSDQAIISAVASYYYQMFFTPKTLPEEEDIQKMAVHTIKTTGVEASVVFDVISKAGEVTSFTDLPSMITKCINSSRLDGLDPASLINMFKSSWYGSEASELIKVAFEHPPTWVALIHAALSDRSYRNSIIAKVAEAVAKRGRGDEFMRAYSNLISEAVSLESAKLDVSREELLNSLL